MQVQTVSFSSVMARLLANERQLKGLDQAGMAQQLGITPPSYSRLEAGQTALTIDTLFSIAEVLGLKVSDLVIRAERVIAQIQESDSVQMAPLVRSNSKGADNSVGTFITGAALGALIGVLLSGGKS